MRVAERSVGDRGGGRGGGSEPGGGDRSDLWLVLDRSIWLQEQGATVHLANPSGLNWGTRRVKNDERDAIDPIDMLRLGRLPEARSRRRQPSQPACRSDQSRHHVRRSSRGVCHVNTPTGSLHAQSRLLPQPINNPIPAIRGLRSRPGARTRLHDHHHDRQGIIKPPRTRARLSPPGCRRSN